MKLKEVIDRSITWGVNLPATPWQLVALFAVTVIIRNLMEAVSLGIVFPASSFLLHFPVAYVYPMLSLVFFMRIFSGYSAAKLLKIMVFAWTLTLLPPVIDRIANTSSAIGYFPLERSNAVWFLLNFFNPSVTLNGTTTGIRIEAAVGCILAGIFTWAVAPRRRILRGILNSIVFAPVFLTFFTWPYLICAIFQPLFPGDGVTNSLLQWHAATEAPTTGASHFTTYLIDMLPVSLLSLWFVRELVYDRWNQLKSNFRNLLPLYLSSFLGTAAAFAVIPATGTTFVDAVIIIGALLAVLWLVTASVWQGSFRAVASTVALSLAWACGWITLVFAGLALATAGLPGLDRQRRALLAATLFVTALSPVGFTLTAPSAILALVFIPIAVYLSQRKLSWLLLLAIPAVALLSAPPASKEGAWIRGVVRRTDTFARSSRVDLAMQSASGLAAGGGSWLTLAETTHLSGQDERSRYVCETAMSRGDSTSSLMKVMMNLAFVRGDTSSFNSIFRLYLNSEDESEISDAVTMRVSFLAMAGDTAALNLIHSRGGMNPMLLRSMATAQLALGDTVLSLQYSRAFLETPAAAAQDWAQTIILAAVTGKENWDSLYTEAEDRLGFCLPVMLARLRAPVIAEGAADRRDLLQRCILIKPDGYEVLETAAMWFSAAGKPDSALIFASRAIAGQADPSMTCFSLALNAALDSGNYTEAAITARYAMHCFPYVIENRVILAGILRARGNMTEAIVLEESFTGIPWAELMCDSLASAVCAAEN